jgi:tetratricopeptide (TPR) repeat protein
MKLLAVFFITFFTQFAMASGGGGGGGMSAPSGPSAAKKSPEQKAVETYNQGIKYRDKAWASLEKAESEGNPKKVAKLEKKAKKHFRNAVKRYRKAIKYYEVYSKAHGSLGYALRQLGDYPGALVAYNRSLEINPRYGNAIEYRGETYLALGELAKTRAAYIELLKIDPALAQELMVAIEAWLTAPPNTVDKVEVEQLRDWVQERVALLDVFPVTSGQKQAWSGS